MNNDAKLLRAYAGDSSEGAFTELVKRHVGLVYSVALRRLGRDSHLAEDVTQMVFSDLARKAKSLLSRPTLSGWLYVSAQVASAVHANASAGCNPFSGSSKTRYSPVWPISPTLA